MGPIVPPELRKDRCRALGCGQNQTVCVAMDIHSITEVSECLGRASSGFLLVLVVVGSMFGMGDLIMARGSFGVVIMRSIYVDKRASLSVDTQALSLSRLRARLLVAQPSAVLPVAADGHRCGVTCAVRCAAGPGAREHQHACATCMHSGMRFQRRCCAVRLRGAPRWPAPGRWWVDRLVDRLQFARVIWSAPPT